MLAPIPLSLYIHLPWCIRKCPYCDFNSHRAPDALPDEDYVTALLADLDRDLTRLAVQPLHSIFIGGGTPSLFSGEAIARLLEGVASRLAFSADIEITLEANPGASDAARFAAYRAAGVNRLSIGVQSFDNAHLKRLGRVHDTRAAHAAIESARSAGFDNINIDLMHGLPHQTVEEAIQDLQQAISASPTHLSWYQLTLEPNTVFYKYPPPLPHEDRLEAIEQAGYALLAEAGFARYEVSAYARHERYSQHNLNYWQYGDYLGIGAGAHGKLTDPSTGMITRLQKIRMPGSYLEAAESDSVSAFMAAEHTVEPANRGVDFLMNALRLHRPVAFSLFEARTGLDHARLTPTLLELEKKGLLEIATTQFTLTSLGHRFLNDVITAFMGR